MRASRRLLQERHRSHYQSVSEDAAPHGRSIASATAGPASHAAPSTLVETVGSTPCMASWTPTYQSEPGLCNSLGPLEEPSLDREGRGHGNGLQLEGCHDRCLHRLGALCEGKPGFLPLVKSRKRLPHQLLGDASSMSSLPVLPAGPNRAPCSDPLRQHVRGVLYKSPGRSLPEVPLHSGRESSGVGQLNLRSQRAAHLPGKLNQGADMLSRRNVLSEERPCAYSRPISGQEQLSCPLSEGSQEAESASAPHCPYMGFAHCVKGPEGPSL